MANFTPQEIEEMLQEFFDTVGKRQYVGARYVPIFGRKGEDTITWNNFAPYEPLTVVIHNGVSYVSKQYVPAGIDITDTAFWAETYRFNAQVEQYRQEVLSFQSQIDTLRSDLESDYVPFPDSAIYQKYGTLGQVLTTLSNGETKWEDPVTVDAEIAEPLIEDWLDAHPEATTTVQDNSITDAKLIQSGGILQHFNELKQMSTVVAVTASTYQTVLPDLNNAVNTSVYVINFADGATAIPAHTPFGTTWSGATAVLYNVVRTQGQRSNLDYQIFVSLAPNAKAYSRCYAGGWYPWSEVGEKTISVNSGNYQTTLPDLDDVKNAEYYKLNFADDATSIPANLPFSTWPGGMAVLIPFVSALNAVSSTDFQMLVHTKESTTIYTRYRAGNTWLPWVSSVADTTYIMKFYNTSLIGASTYATIMPDLNDVHTNQTYFLNFARNTAAGNYPAHTPFKTVWEVDGALFTSYARNTSQATNGDFQIIIAPTYDKQLQVFTRYYAYGWSEWVSPQSGRTIIVDQNGSGDFTTLRAGVEEAIKYEGSTVIVNAGTYDLCSEFAAELAGAYTGQFGIKLERNVHVIFSPKAFVTALYDGADSAITTNFAPFFAGINGGYTIENLNLNATCTRYGIHDEAMDCTSLRQVNIINCIIKTDNTGAVLDYYPQCIGGGNGIEDVITINNCYFYCEQSEAEPTTIVTPCVSYHNNVHANAMNRVTISNCYFNGYGTFRVTYHGPSTEKSIAICNNNSCGIAPFMKEELPTDTTVNWELLAYANEIRHP